MTSPGAGQAGPAAPANAVVKPALPDNAKPWNKPLTASVDAVLLDVARPPASSETAAILRVAGGQIETRDPGEDRTSELYKRIVQSAKQGENQPAPGGMAAKPQEQPGAQPGPIKKGREVPKPPPPSGGGGGAGGG
jgi:hypothetical protein